MLSISPNFDGLTFVTCMSFDLFCEVHMKSVVNRISVLLATLHLAGTLGTAPAHSQVMSAMSHRAGTHSLAQEQTPQAQPVPPHLRALDQDNPTVAVPLIEQTWEKQFEDYFQVNFSNESTTVTKIAETLSQITQKTGKKSALLYIVPRPQQLELILITPEGKPIHKRVPEAKREAIQKQIQEK